MTDRNMDGIPERALVVPALQLAADHASGEIETSDLIAGLTDIFKPVGKDAEIIHGRNDTHFSQKVRNLISHRNQNFIASGYAEYTGGGIRITEQGRKLLRDLGH